MNGSMVNAGVTVSADEAKKLLDFSQELNLNLLEQVVKASFSGTNLQQTDIANTILVQFKDHPESWTRVDKILENSTHAETRYYALQILDKTVHERWQLIPVQQREQVRMYVINTICKIANDPDQFQRQKVLLTKLNMVLVQILKKDWPHAWPNFISEIVASSQNSQHLCLNNMNILTLFCEEVFEFSQGQMTQVKTKRLRDSIVNQFSDVFSLCIFVFENSTHLELLLVTLNTLLNFLSWIPLGYIFETSLLQTLVKYLAMDKFRNVSLKCLTEISSVELDDYQYGDYFIQLAEVVFDTVQKLVPFEGLANAYPGADNQTKDFVRCLALFFTSFLKNHSSLLEKNPNKQLLVIEMHQCLIRVTEVDDKEIFKICLEYWREFTEQLYNESPLSSTSVQNMFANANNTPRRDLYSKKSDVLNPLRRVMIAKMVKPEEVLVVETENGELIREFMPQHTDSLSMFITMRETLVYLTHLDFLSTKSIMEEKLVSIVESENWTWQNLNTLCWAIGAISGAMGIGDEKQFIVQVIRYLLSLCEQVNGKSNKAVVASNIMYVVGQYPRFLKAHWKFLKVVVKKLFEFMHESHEGVQDMSCDTFLKISKKCRRLFVTQQVGEGQPFINEILMDLRGTVSELHSQQVGMFYEACGYMITAQSDLMTRNRLVTQLMELPNTHWKQCIQQVSANQNCLYDQEVLKPLSTLLQTNISACSSIGHPFVVQLDTIYGDLLNLYSVLSEFISNAVSREGETVLKQISYRKMVGVKRDTLKLIKTWISHSNDWSLLRDNYLESLFSHILSDYRSSSPAAREPEVLCVLTAIIEQHGPKVNDQIPFMFEAVFQCTLEMITSEFTSYPVHRTSIYALLEAMCANCFDAFLSVPAPEFESIINSVIWAIKHTMRPVAESGLNILNKIFTQACKGQVSQEFFRSYFLLLLEHVIALITDSSFQPAFKKHSEILCLMIQIIDNGIIQIQLKPDQTQPNKEFMQYYLKSLLLNAFPTLQQQQVDTILSQLFTHYQDASFKSVLTDFLVQTKVHDDEREIAAYTQDAQQHMAEAQDRMKKLAHIPGMMNPNLIDDSDIV